MTRSWRRLFATACLCALPALARGGPPFVTDDPEPVALKQWEIYLATQHLKTAGAWSGTAPHVEANYGALSELQLHVIAPLAYEHPVDSPATTGYGDTEFGAKYRFLRETAHRPQAGIFALVEAPTGSRARGLGGGHMQVFLPLWLQKSRGPWTTYGGGGYWINPGAGNRNWGYAGWLLQRDLSKYLTLGAEAFHRTPSSVGGGSATGFNAGGQLNFAGHSHFLFSGGKDFSGPNELTFYFALQWTS